MSDERKPLARRRAELVAECELQRLEVRQEFAELRAPVRVDGIGGIGGYLATHRKLLLGVAGVALGLVASRPKRLLSLAAAGMSVYKMARGLLPLIARLRGQAI
jgi:hypothetical protein